MLKIFNKIINAIKDMCSAGEAAKEYPYMKGNLTCGTKLIVSILDVKLGKKYNSNIEDIDDEKIVISMPTNKGTPMPIAKNLRLRFLAFDNCDVIAFESRVTGIIKTPHFMLIISLPETLKHAQMRHYFRMSVKLNVKFCVSNMDKAEQTHFADFENGVVEDLSGGGCRMSHSAVLRLTDEVVVDFTGTDIEDVWRVQCRVVRIPGEDSKKKTVNLRFINISEASQNRITRYVHRKQINLKKNNA